MRFTMNVQRFFLIALQQNLWQFINNYVSQLDFSKETHTGCPKKDPNLLNNYSVESLKILHSYLGTQCTRWVVIAKILFNLGKTA